MQQTILMDVLAKRRDRAAAIILSLKEREIDPMLSDSPRGREASVRLRKVVLDQLNDLTDLCSDLMRSLDNDSAPVINDLWVRKLDEIHDAVVSSNGN